MTVTTEVSGSRARSGEVRIGVEGARRTAGGWLKPSLIASVGLLGLLVAVLALLPLVGWQVVRLATGSMSPGLPADSLLLAHRVDASSVHIGDIITVQREGEMPITHRVISVVPGVAPGEPATIELRGDANDTPDPAPYTVANVDLVAFGVPWGGQIVAAVRSPLVLGGLTVAVTLFVLWAWWPRRREHEAVVPPEE